MLRLGKTTAIIGETTDMIFPESYLYIKALSLAFFILSISSSRLYDGNKNLQFVPASAVFSLY